MRGGGGSCGRIYLRWLGGDCSLYRRRRRTIGGHQVWNGLGWIDTNAAAMGQWVKA